jgi:hypothetical protein
MSTRKTKAQAKATPHVHYHKDGTAWAEGQLVEGVPTGYWGWFRKDGVRMRSGYFDAVRAIYDRDWRQ